MVDWLGRGGIAHCTEAWVHELRAAGESVELVTRSGRELVTAVSGSREAGGRGSALTEYLAVVATARRIARELDPRVVVLNGTVLPQVELGLLRASQRRNSTVIFVAHEPAPPHNVPGSHRALARLIRAADVVITHTAFVADNVSALTGRHDLKILPLPIPVGLIAGGLGAVPVVELSAVPLALMFGNLHRTYKGSTMVEEVAVRGVDGWRFALVGKGAPVLLPGATTVSRFLESGELVATVSSSAATLLPYTRASQSAAVVLAQAVGSVVVATSVGGIPEQVENRVTGRLLPLGAGVECWRDVLIELSDPEERAQLAAAARSSVERAHVEFTAGVLKIVGAVR
ncbi:MAG: glycosyltransferase [Acidimicrobiales bacterium]|jgi:glycosyltransferase involved in cell wall biosynthesis